MAAGHRSAIKIGLLGGLAAWHVALVGMVETFAARQLIGTTISLGYALIFMLMLLVGNIAARQISDRRSALTAGAVAGGLVGLALTLLALLSDQLSLRNIFVFASPRLVQILTLEQGMGAGLIYPVVVGLIAGALGAGISLLPTLWRRVITTALVVTVLVGLMRDVLVPVVGATVLGRIFTVTGLTLTGAIAVFLITAGLTWAGRVYGLPGIRSSSVGTPDVKETSSWLYVYLGIAALFLFSFPLWAGPFLSNIAVMVGFFIIMGLGLNLVVGFAGLLDLGYVAFFAIGAYTVAILTSVEMPYQLSFWVALPIAMLAAMIAGVLLGLPVLRMRGDYLAIATLGFGEIIRILVLSDALRGTFGGAQGIILIDRPEIGTFTIDNAQKFYYMVIIGCLIAWFVSVRLRDSRIGRAWMAIREDEDVAQAMGINRVTAKLLAFSIGAFLGGLAGAMFASLLGSVVPRSFELLISINVLALIIVGGMGSLPGVIVGALALVGLPELLREFREYRLLVYGAVLVLMMLYRPEGLWPEERRKAELHEAEEEPVTEEVPAAVPTDRPPREAGTPPVQLEER